MKGRLLPLLLLALLSAGCRKQEAEAEPPPFGCDQAPLPTQAAVAAAPQQAPETATPPPATEEKSTATAEATATEAGPVLPPGSVALLDLPFPYDGSEEGFGGSVSDFTSASQRRRSGGRVNSFFDHQLPLYGAEAEAPGSTGSILIFDGSASPSDAYSGHPGYDFSVLDEANRRSTPVLAAAGGVVTKVEWHDLMGWHVMMRHDVPDVGAFQTIYMHLQDDTHFADMRALIDTEIEAGARIGTMGTTGNSDGEHLHFEVRFDINGDGRFRYGQETVDPFGFLPSLEYAASPWLERQGMGPPRYLWRVPLQTAARIPADGSGDLAAPSGLGGAGGPDRAATAGARGEGGATGADDGGLCAPPDSLPPGGTVQLGWAPDPAPSEDLAGVGGSVVVSVVDEEGRPVEELDPPLAVEIPFDEKKLDDVDPDSLSIHRWDPEPTDSTGFGRPLGRVRGLAQADPLAAPGGRWVPLPTRVDLERGLAVAATDRPARLALLGRPLRDMVAPTTRIVLDGPQGAGGRFYEAVTVTLIAEDPSGIDSLRYKLGFEGAWRAYGGPFVLQHADIPGDVPAGVDVRFMHGAGRRLVVASAIDGAGNVEEPPASQSVVIDLRADPVYTPPPPTATVVLTGTARAAATGTATVLAGDRGESELEDGLGDDGGEAGSDEGAGTPVPGDEMDRPVAVSPVDGGVESTATPIAARSGDSSSASGLAPGVATAAARPALPAPTLAVVGPISPTPAATATATTAPRRATPMIVDPGVESSSPTPTPPATPVPTLPAPVIRAPADRAEPACGEPVVLDWDGVPALGGRGGHRWELQQLVVGEGWQPLDSGEVLGSPTSITLGDPPCGTGLRWRVRGVDPSGRLGEWSPWRTLKPQTAPDPPTAEAPSGYPYP